MSSTPALFTEQDVVDVRETAEAIRTYYGSAKIDPPHGWEVSVDFWMKRARRLRDLASRLERSLAAAPPASTGAGMCANCGNPLGERDEYSGWQDLQGVIRWVHNWCVEEWAKKRPRPAAAPEQRSEPSE